MTPSYSWRHANWPSFRPRPSRGCCGRWPRFAPIATTRRRAEVVNRRSLVLEGAQAASDARDSVGIDLIAPVDIYAVAESIGIRVRFLPVSMEGFYRKGSPPRVMLSALRPLARRAFTCAHEI